MKKKTVLIYTASNSDLKIGKIFKFYQLFLRLILYLLKFYLYSRKMKKNVINTLNVENKELWCLERTLRHDRHFGDEDNIPWAIFISLALEQNIALSESWGVVWPCKIGVNVNGSTLLTNRAQTLNDAQKSSLRKTLERNNAEPIFVNGVDFFLIRFRDQNFEFNTFLPTVGQIYLKPVLSNDKRGRRWLEILTEIEMEWYKEGLTESINSLWAWSINPAKLNIPPKKITNTNEYDFEVNSTQDIAIYGFKKFADHFLQTSYDIIPIPEYSFQTKNLHVNHIRSARILFFKKFNNVHMRPNTDIYIFRKIDGVHYSQTFENIETQRQSEDYKTMLNKIPKSIFHPFE